MKQSMPDSRGNSVKGQRGEWEEERGNCLSRKFARGVTSCRFSSGTDFYIPYELFRAFCENVLQLSNSLNKG